MPQGMPDDPGLLQLGLLEGGVPSPVARLGVRLAAVGGRKYIDLVDALAPSQDAHGCVGERNAVRHLALHLVGVEPRHAPLKV